MRGELESDKIDWKKDSQSFDRVADDYDTYRPGKCQFSTWVFWNVRGMLCNFVDQEIKFRRRTRSNSIHGRTTLVQTAPVRTMFGPLTVQWPIALASKFNWITSAAGVLVPVMASQKIVMPLHLMLLAAIS